MTFASTKNFDQDVSALNVSKAAEMADIFKGAEALSDCNKGRIFREWKQYNVDLDASKLLYGSSNTHGGAFQQEYLAWEKLFPRCYDVLNTTRCFGMRSAIDSGSEAAAEKALLADTDTGTGAGGLESTTAEKALLAGTDMDTGAGGSESTTATPCKDDDAAMKSGSVGTQFYVPTCGAAKEYCQSGQIARGGTFKGDTMGSIAKAACACTCPGAESATATPCEDDDAAMKSGSVGNVPTCSGAKEYCDSGQIAPGGPFKGDTMGSIAKAACACTCQGDAGAGSKGDSSDGFPVVIVAVAAAVLVLVLLLCVLLLFVRKQPAESDKSSRQDAYVNPAYVRCSPRERAGNPTKDITLSKPLGMSFNHDPVNAGHFIVTKIAEGKNAHAGGEVKPGMRILAINGQDLGAITSNKTVTALIKGGGATCTLKLEVDNPAHGTRHQQPSARASRTRCAHTSAARAPCLGTTLSPAHQYCVRHTCETPGCASHKKSSERNCDTHGSSTA